MVMIRPAGEGERQHMILTSLKVDPLELEARTGWAIKPEGACKGDICVPLGIRLEPEGIDARVLSEKLGMPLVRDEATNTWCLGPAALGRALNEAKAPELVLSDLEGKEFRLSSLRGQKVLLLAWASW
jgi:hypothetical protein